VRITGLDYSLTALGAVSIDTASGRTWATTVKPGTRVGGERLEYLAREMTRYLIDCDLVIVEAPSFNSKSSSRDAILGMHGVLNHTIFRRRVPYATVPPASLKMYVTGHGNAEKQDIERELRLTFPGLNLADDNQWDALGLATMGAAWKNLALDGARTRWTYELDKVNWPGSTGEPVRKVKPRKPARTR
jgi:Holliday junction resolvasome RuvABC endonuclease subunit